MYKRKIMGLILIFTALFSFNAIAANLVKINDSGFEEKATSKNNVWNKEAWDKQEKVTQFYYDRVIYKSGKQSACIVNNPENDARYTQKISVDENSIYKISCWVRTENVGNQGKGANISVAGVLGTSQDIKGTSNQWELLTLYGKTDSNQKELTLTIGIGGYGAINTGKAWFDDIEVYKLDSVPEGAVVVDFYNKNTKGIENKTEKVNSNSHIGKVILFSVVVIMIVIAACALLYQKRKSKEYIYFIITCGIGLIIRMIFSIYSKGHPIDMGCFRGWASLASNDFFHFYNGKIFTDYPPLYVYVLFILGKLCSLSTDAQISNLIIKFPSIIADLVTAFILFKVSCKYTKKGWSWVIGAIYIFNPLVIINSSIWGQIDSFFTLFIVCALILLAKQEIVYTSIVFSLAILLKPQGIIFFPVLFFLLLKMKKPSNFLIAFATAICTLIIIIIPFSFYQEPLWIVKLYLKTISEYPYASLNAFNLFALIGANWRLATDSIVIFGVNMEVSYKTMGFIFIVMTTLFAGYLQLKNNKTEGAFLSALVLIVGVFVLASGMHERYMFPATAISLLLYLYTNNIKIMIFYIATSITGFINTLALYQLSIKNVYQIGSNDMTLLVVSFLNVLLLVYLIKISLDYTKSNSGKRNHKITDNK